MMRSLVLNNKYIYSFGLSDNTYKMVPYKQNYYSKTNELSK